MKYGRAMLLVVAAMIFLTVAANAVVVKETDIYGYNTTTKKWVKVAKGDIFSTYSDVNAAFTGYATIGGGKGSTGCTIGAEGNVATDGTLLVVGATTITGALSLGAATGAIVVPASSSAVGKAIGITAGAGNGGTTTGYAGGAITLTTGAGSNGSETGGAGGAITLTSAAGGTGATGGAGGQGGANAAVAGAGGAATTNGTGGAGGAITRTAGVGGASATGTTGAGGGVTLTAGNAGAASGAGTSGAAGAVAVVAGNGGAVTTGTGGAGGAITLTTGTGGNGSAAGGSGGALNLYTGAAGSGGTGVSGALAIKSGGSGGVSLISSSGAQGALGNVLINPLRPIATTVGAGNLAQATASPTIALHPSGSVFVLTHASPNITIPAAAAANAGVVWTFVGTGVTSLTITGTASDIVANCADSSSAGCATLLWNTASHIVGVTATLVSNGSKWILIAGTVPTSHT